MLSAQKSELCCGITLCANGHGNPNTLKVIVLQVVEIERGHYPPHALPPLHFKFLSEPISHPCIEHITPEVSEETFIQPPQRPSSTPAPLLSYSVEGRNLILAGHSYSQLFRLRLKCHSGAETS